MKDTYYQLRLSSKDKKFLMDTAADMGLSLAAFLLYAALKEAKRKR